MSQSTHRSTSFVLLRKDSEVSETSLVRVPPKVDAIGNRVGFAVIEAAVIPNPEEIASMRLRILALH